MSIEQVGNRIIIRGPNGQKEIKYQSERQAREEKQKIDHIRDNNPKQDRGIND